MKPKITNFAKDYAIALTWANQEGRVHYQIMAWTFLYEQACAQQKQLQGIFVSASVVILTKEEIAAMKK